LRRIDANTNAIVANEQTIDVSFPDRVDRIEITGDTPHDADRTVNGTVHSMVVARRKIDDRE
jgi:hypothetical protein